MKIHILRYYSPSAGDMRSFHVDKRSLNRERRKLYADGCGGFFTSEANIAPTAEALVAWLNDNADEAFGRHP